MTRFLAFAMCFGMGCLMLVVWSRIGCPIFIVCSRIGFFILVVSSGIRCPLFVVCFNIGRRIMHNEIDGEFAVELRLLHTATTQWKSMVNTWAKDGTNM